MQPQHRTRSGVGADIGPNSVLIFDVEIIDFDGAPYWKRPDDEL